MKPHYGADLRTLANEDDNIIGLWKKVTVMAAIYDTMTHFGPGLP
jgi:hypothetical protein